MSNRRARRAVITLALSAGVLAAVALPAQAGSPSGDSMLVTLKARSSPKKAGLQPTGGLGWAPPGSSLRTWFQDRSRTAWQSTA